MRVALTGASGVVGRFVAARLAREGCEYRCPGPPGERPHRFDFPVTWIEGDLDNEVALVSLVRGADALVHCAFDHVAGRYRGGEGDDVESFWRTNLLGSLRLLRAAVDCDVGRIVVLSSRAVFGRPARTRVGDNHPPSPTTHYGALKVALESLAGAYPQTTCIRPTGVYGITLSAMPEQVVRHGARRDRWPSGHHGAHIDRSPRRRRGGRCLDIAHGARSRCLGTRLQLFRPRREHPRDRRAHVRHSSWCGRTHGNASGGVAAARQHHALRRSTRPRLAARRPAAGCRRPFASCSTRLHTLIDPPNTLLTLIRIETSSSNVPKQMADWPVEEMTIPTQKSLLPLREQR